MNKKNTIIFVVAGIALLLVGFVVGTFAEITPEKLEEKEAQSLEKHSCNETTLYSDVDGIKIYSNCLNEIKILDGDKSIELKDYLENHSLDDFIKRLEYVDSLNDGGTAIYKDGGTKKYTSDDMTVIKCHKISSVAPGGFNEDIYIGPSTLQYEENFCKDDVVGKTLVETYNIRNIEESNDGDYLWLTIRGFQSEEVGTFKVLKSIANDVKADSNYEFTFEITSNDIQLEFLSSIFENAELKKIVKTSKSGLDQVNDLIKD